ncbi:hypothetical protein [Cytobacillus depressus]|uniref:hypothetical protein n=1 Tax=Cytobacillus depressus TaxID=1602942 RepID=UPI00124CB60B|nr:hypothetical protein [Cytobacillus depressus]
MKRKELESTIKNTEEAIKVQQLYLKKLYEQLEALNEQEKERKKYISSKEIIELIYKNIGKNVNLSTIKRWADEGFLGEVIDEKEKFWALHLKQGKKRFLYPKMNAFNFLYEKGYLFPQFEVLDRVMIMDQNNNSVIGIVVDSCLQKGHFQYTIQIEETFAIIKDIEESYLSKVTGDVDNI